MAKALALGYGLTSIACLPTIYGRRGVRGRAGQGASTSIHSAPPGAYRRSAKLVRGPVALYEPGSALPNTHPLRECWSAIRIRRAPLPAKRV
jgi:hypothetical protein